MQNLTVMVLEDEPFQRLVTVTALEKILSSPVLQAADGDEAIAALETCSHIDIVLCDLKMAGTDGLAFLRHASSSRKVRAVALCSELDPVLRHATASMIHCLGLTYLGDLGKPFNKEGFNELITRYQAHCNATPRLLLPSELPTLNDVLLGLDNGEFEAYYQPKVTLQGQALVGAEVLARWAHPQLGVLTPAHFLPVMEQHHLIDRMFWHLFEQGLALHQRLVELRLESHLAFNLHPMQLANRALTHRIPILLRQAQVSPSSVMFEITESGLLNAPANSLENLVRLRILGCGLAMDDFGAGYSSLDRLSELPFSEIKLDRAFVHKMQSQPRSAAIISCSVALAQSLNIELVIEGVETLEQQARLIDLGCTVAQGFLFARPMPESHFINYCMDRSTRRAETSPDE
ncbi:EAL domain, c-di-GMP-specific phosphodiesterase class I (or its enzymatically inactive variant) [Pseudomonas sp. NFPP10]|uniref:EAL domain-containing response regulator n=1 Tax=Pseudomonas TaxID=286 RepID=UPI00087EC5CE|nr:MULTISPECIES: EAL domain-containing response regulator [Pseudomonas]POA89894.1 diguanylate phosphodiesterase [Pseudomonas protegens]PZP09640.1 MAG: diguanylate phosphodiesterase [Pseudomonas protegens]ROM16294.1 diguanylate phosphodiesterase [Pseudomonas protegens]SDA21314.1 EAL domain, c-di-GMP-specific phosphodiesterase class I (or its enzymatically inactive variant) [Pseudomonas sp. NFPP12]SEL35761.1 EAL domain, c-di-GMP-specific phosphodiesterase class I (or its enzymatically inactive v